MHSYGIEKNGSTFKCYWISRIFDDIIGGIHGDRINEGDVIFVGIFGEEMEKFEGRKSS